MDFDRNLFKSELPEDVKKAKLWLFQEQVRIQAKQEELQELNRELQDLKKSLEREKTRLDLREQTLNKRYDDNEVFIAKKKKIIEDAYQQLDLDKKALECERLNFEHEKNRYRRQKMADARANGSSHRQSGGSAMSSYDGSSFFRGVDNEIELRKRYKELLKIFHPDNKCGDTKTLIMIQTEYENLRSRYNEG
jgi:chromosome segregation ATPase